MRVLEPRLSREGEEFVYRATVTTAGRSSDLWYRVPGEFGALVSRRSDAALVALILPAMAAGEDLEFEGTVSERLLVALSGPFQRLVCQLLPSLRPTKIDAHDVRAAAGERAPGVATGFSAGVDSYAVLVDYHFRSAPRRHKITHLLFNDVGSHGDGGERLFRARLSRLLPVAANLGLPIVPVSSNLEAFYDRRLDFQRTHTVRNLSVAFLLQEGVGSFLYASTFSYADLFVGPTHDMACADPLILSLLSTETCEAVSVGSEYTRVEKTLRVAELPISHQTLDVCVHGAHLGPRTNCAACWKCLRTLLTLEIAGKLELYEPCFDLEVYRANRRRGCELLLSGADPLQREVLRFAVDRGFELPLAARLLSLPLVRRITSLARRARVRLASN